MIEIVWEFVVKDEFKGHFELVFGPGGAWSKLFTTSPGFRGTNLLRDTKDQRRYLIVDFWDTEAHREEILKELESEYAKLNADFDKWTESRTELGAFRRQAEATVQPRSRKRRSKSGGTRRRRRRTTR